MVMSFRYWMLRRLLELIVLRGRRDPAQGGGDDLRRNGWQEDQAPGPPKWKPTLEGWPKSYQVGAVS